MIDLKLEKQLSDIKELLGLWRKFHEFFVLGVKANDITGEKETQFLRLKSRIAMLCDTFMDALTHDQNIGQHVLSLVERAITLKHLSKLSVAEVKKMEIEWHEAYLLLNETVGILEEKKEDLSHVSPSKYKMAKFMTAAGHGISSFLSSGWFKLIVAIAIIVGILVALPAFNIVDYGKLGEYKYTKPVYDAFMKFKRDTLKMQVPYKKISELNLNISKRKDKNVTEKADPNIRHNKAVNLFQPAPIGDEIMASKEMDVSEYTVGRDNVRIFLFLYEDSTGAQALVKKFQDWKSQNASYLEMFPYSHAATSVCFTKLNIAVFVVSLSQQARDYFKVEEFGS
jgi:hypothetical protein